MMDGAFKIAFLGDMFELGETAAIEHQAIADLAASLHLHNVFLIGENFYRTETALKKFSDFETFAKHLAENSPSRDATLLIKGSRGMALERILDLI